ncbi:MAG: chorismate mutase [Alicyclobacillus macrosporangiidus]|uniref:chorismate mutase n=1 Tax=Alicyclobacillus macrosporangiidus TaxID=392015 RepID=UPI0026F22599|nr:chorismate mutase [Alicyclobacillus macrosporangiidus]MCL6598948.1 chorismate mutase [Alicyclobacillus macrosporangiidus]
MTRVVRGVRGATTAAANTPEEIFRATRELMLAVIEANDLHPEDVASVMLTMTPDLNADFPAKAVRSIDGWQWVPLMCATELAVPGSMPRCIRLLMHVNTDRSQEEMVHMYLGEAVALRPDMVQHAQAKTGQGGTE